MSVLPAALNMHARCFVRTENLHTVYRDPNGRESAFNSLPPAYLENYLNGRDAIVKKFG